MLCLCLSDNKNASVIIDIERMRIIGRMRTVLSKDFDLFALVIMRRITINYFGGVRNPKVVGCNSKTILA